MLSHDKLVLILMCTCVLLLALLPISAGVTTRVSVASVGTQANGDSLYPAISGDGRFSVFCSGAPNLVPGDTNGYRDVFVHDRQTGQTTRVSVASDGTQANRDSGSPSISSDGRCVAFGSYAFNLVAGDTNWTWDIFVHDRQTGQTTRVSVASDGAQASVYTYGQGSRLPAISADGRYVAFLSDAYNLVLGDTNYTWDVFVHDRQTGQTTRVSVSSSGMQGNADSWRPTMSADGRCVGFASRASNLVTDDTNGNWDGFVHDRQTGVTERISVSTEGAQASAGMDQVSVSADGRYAAFYSGASNLVPSDTNGVTDVFVRDRQIGQTTRVSVASEGAQGNDYSYVPVISSDGRYVAFYSNASNLVPGDTWRYDVFVHDRQTGRTTMASAASDGVRGNAESGHDGLSISADGRYVAFESVASNLIPVDTNGYGDIFVRDRWSVHETKAVADGQVAVLSGNTITGSLTGAFYAEDADRASGIKVSWAGAVTEGDRYRVDGTLDTDENGERYINASNVRRIDALPVVPLYLRTDFLGGAENGYNAGTGAGQQGITGAFSMNNIGLFIRALGKVTQKGSDYLYVDDGAGLLDGTLTGAEENVGVRVICNPTGYDTGDPVEAIGISSCFQSPSGLARRILTRRPEDLRKITP